MDKIKLIFSVLGLIFAILSLSESFPYSISATPMFFCMAMAALAGAVEDKQNGRRKTAWFGFLAGLFVLAALAISFFR